MWLNRFISTEGLAGITVASNLTWHKLNIDAERAKEWLTNGNYLSLISSPYICRVVGTALDTTLEAYSNSTPQNIEPGNEVLVVVPGDNGQYTFKLFTSVLRFTDTVQLSWSAKSALEALRAMHNAVSGNEDEQPTLYGDEDKPLVREFVTTLLQIILSKADAEMLQTALAKDQQIAKEKAINWAAAIFRLVAEKDPRKSHSDRMAVLDRVR